MILKLIRPPLGIIGGGTVVVVDVVVVVVVVEVVVVVRGVGGKVLQKVYLQDQCIYLCIHTYLS